MDNYIDTPIEEFLAIYKGLDRYAQREVLELAESLSCEARVAADERRLRRAAAADE
jgi:hypothetical protein